MLFLDRSGPSASWIFCVTMAMYDLLVYLFFCNHVSFVIYVGTLRNIFSSKLEPALQGVGRRGVGDGNLIHKKWLNTHTKTLKPPELIIKISLWSGFRGKKSVVYEQDSSSRKIHRGRSHVKTWIIALQHPFQKIKNTRTCNSTSVRGNLASKSHTKVYIYYIPVRAWEIESDKSALY